MFTNSCTVKHRQLCVKSKHRPTFGACSLFVKKSPSYPPEKEIWALNWKCKLKFSNKPGSSRSKTYSKTLQPSWPPSVEGLYCKRPIQCLASSALLTPTPSPPLVRGEDTLAGWRGGGVSIVRKTPNTALYYICKYFVTPSVLIFSTFNLLLYKKRT